mmetsp:Transcript_31801/g.63953  ORF Transcript_31801/g.63953 Transcript_31801/m.63953 type:complete len:132 (+) Transcript_31801:581-976(+)
MVQLFGVALVLAFGFLHDDSSHPRLQIVCAYSIGVGASILEWKRFALQASKAVQAWFVTRNVARKRVPGNEREMARFKRKEASGTTLTTTSSLPTTTTMTAGHGDDEDNYTDEYTNTASFSPNDLEAQSGL